MLEQAKRLHLPPLFSNWPTEFQCTSWLFWGSPVLRFSQKLHRCCFLSPERMLISHKSCGYWDFGPTCLHFEICGSLPSSFAVNVVYEFLILQLSCSVFLCGIPWAVRYCHHPCHPSRIITIFQFQLIFAMYFSLIPSFSLSQEGLGLVWKEPLCLYLHTHTHTRMRMDIFVCVWDRDVWKVGHE